MLAVLCFFDATVFSVNKDLYKKTLNSRHTIYMFNIQLARYKRHDDVTATRGATFQTDPKNLERSGGSKTLIRGSLQYGTVHGSVVRATCPWGCRYTRCAHVCERRCEKKTEALLCVNVAPAARPASIWSPVEAQLDSPSVIIAVSQLCDYAAVLIFVSKVLSRQ